MLHMWSLSLEEQFYFFLPLLMLATPRRWLLTVLMIVVGTSFLACLYYANKNPDAAFYLLPTRAWELGIGGVVALLLRRDFRWSGTTGLPTIALLVLILVPLVSPDQWLGLTHPGLDAFLVCMATASVIYFGHGLLSEGWLARALNGIGAISYSLYLVHWPLVAFANNIYLRGEVPFLVRMGIAIASIALALLLYRTVEQPFRFGAFRPILIRSSAIMGVVVAAVIGTSILGPDAKRKVQAGANLAPNFGLSSNCEYFDHLERLDECQTSDQPRYMVWGDSYAMHFVPAIAAADIDVIQATKSVCGPFLDLTPETSSALRGNLWIEDCRRFNQSVLEEAMNDPSLDIIIIASLINQYIYGPVINSSGQSIQATPEILAEDLSFTTEQLRAAGKRVIFLAPPPTEGAMYNPEPGFDIGECHARRAADQITFITRSECEIDRNIYEIREAKVRAFLSRIEDHGISSVLRLEHWLCDEARCLTAIGDTPLYRDHGHLSIEGAKALTNTYDIIEYIERNAD